MNILFWNTAKKPVNEMLVSLVEENSANVVVLAEYCDNELFLLRELRSKLDDYKIVPRIACSRITMLTNYPTHVIKHRRDGDRYSIKELHLQNSIRLMLVMVHLPSKLHLSEDDQAVHASLIREEIEEIEQECGHSNTVIIGDFNMNPFDKGMVSAMAFNSIPCMRAHKKNSRNIQGREFKFFYNPSWNLLGDRNESAGTYFHKSPGTLSYYWNTLDQVLIRPSLAKQYPSSRLSVLTMSRRMSLIEGNSVPAISDHLPIMFTLEQTGVKQ